MMQLFVHEQLGQSHHLILSWRIFTCPYILFIIMQGMYRPQNDLLDHLLLLLPGILTVGSLCPLAVLMATFSCCPGDGLSGSHLLFGHLTPHPSQFYAKSLTSLVTSFSQVTLVPW